MDTLRILVVEDLPDVANSTAQVLELWGYQPTVAYDGKQAVQSLSGAIYAAFWPLFSPEAL